MCGVDSFSGSDATSSSVAKQSKNNNSQKQRTKQIVKKMRLAADRKRTRKMMQRVGWRTKTRAASRRKRMLEQQAKRWHRRRQRCRFDLALTKRSETSSRVQLLARDDDAETWAPRSSREWSGPTFGVVRYAETATTTTTTGAPPVRVADGAASERIAPKSTAPVRPHRQPLGPSGLRNLADAAAVCTPASNGDGRLAQVHRCATRLAAAAAASAASTRLPDATSVQASPTRKIKATRAQAIASIFPPKASSTFSIDCRRPRRAYLLLPKRSSEADGRANRLGLAQLSATDLDLDTGIKRGPNGISEDGNRATKIRSNSYLLRNIRTVIGKAQPTVVLPTSQGGTLTQQQQHHRNTSLAARLDKLRPPVRRLKSVPVAVNQDATQTNNRSTVVRRGVGCAGAGAAGSGCGVLVSVLGVVRHRANMVRPFRGACDTVLDTTRKVGGVGGERWPMSAGARPYQTRQQRAIQPNLAQVRPNPAGLVVNSAPSNDRQQDLFSEVNQIKASSLANPWHWSDTNRSHECVVSEDRLSLCFHPHCSESAAACMSAEPLKRNGNYYYWEIHVQDKIYGTSVMFGLCTKRQRLHLNEYCNIVGLDQCGWSLSHKGLAWHKGSSAQYTSSFPANQPITIGLLYNTLRGELSYFMDGKNLGVAFRGLNDVEDELYPVVASTAKCTQMTLVGSWCGHMTLLQRSCFALLKSVAQDRYELIEYLRQQNLPKHLLQYVAQVANVDCKNDTDLTSSTVKQIK